MAYYIDIDFECVKILRIFNVLLAMLANVFCGLRSFCGRRGFCGWGCIAFGNFAGFAGGVLVSKSSILNV